MSLSVVSREPLPKPPCCFHPGRDADVLICLGCGDELQVGTDDEIIEIVHQGSSFWITVDHCDACDEFIGTSQATDAQVRIVDRETGREKYSMGWLLCKQCDKILSDYAMHGDDDFLEKVRGLFKNRTTFKSKFYRLMIEECAYHCALEPDCGSSRDDDGAFVRLEEYMVGCLDCGTLYPQKNELEVVAKGYKDMQICTCGAMLPYILSAEEVLQSRGRFLCLKHAELLGNVWRENVLEYESKGGE